ncbi:hypothetical protein [Wielerella bovis]|uniref:phage tail tube protein n=1 Tax=Wielerella bovis TaxID=2917790 RepID=UPI0020193D37|nr:hypothetical protein [Wielerella bovis]MCG7657121.1 hypothetical protein [Wielerella bovis]MCG7659344.1 hypothetical protein [Wielerella bovis]
MATMIEHEPKYYSGQGKLHIAPVKGGVIQYKDLRWVGNVPELSIDTEIEVGFHKESWSGMRAKDAPLKKEKSVKFKAKLEEFTQENIALAFHAAATEIQAGTVSEEIAPADLTSGNTWLLAHRNVNTVVITDSATAPVTLEAGKHYQIDELFGRVELLDIKTLKPPFKAAYKHGAATRLSAMTENFEGWYLRFEGLNTVADNRPVLVEIFKSDISPTKTLELINDELGSFDLEGEALLHNGKLTNIELL